MKRTLFTIAAAFAALLSAASAKTIVVADVIARNGGVPASGVLDLGDVAIRFFAPQPARATEEDFARAVGAHGTGVNSQTILIPAERAAFTAIYVNGAFKITNLKFNDGDPGSLTKTRKTLVINGVAYHFSKVGGLALDDSLIVMRRGGSNPTTFSLEAFDVEALETPLPAAGFLMLAGLAGIGFAMGRRKRN
ncbi:MAG: hypothetical protein HXY21_10035 [Parvularculaceae bacterium]|nr:hypothetical protein [Parvularculaceae bacterium]